MSKRNKMYILIETDSRSKNIQIVSSEKIKGLIVPSEDVIRTHLQLEKEKIKTTNNYIPQPLKIPMKKEDFDDCMSQICAMSNPINKQVIPMAYQYPALPCVIIYREAE